MGPGCVRGKDADAELAAHAPDDIEALLRVVEAAAGILRTGYISEEQKAAYSLLTSTLREFEKGGGE